MTRFATNFISLQFVVEQKINLKKMFLGLEWMASEHSKALEGIEIVALVFNDGFWKDAEEIIAVTESLVKVLRYFKSFNFFHFKNFISSFFLFSKFHISLILKANFQDG